MEIVSDAQPSPSPPSRPFSGAKLKAPRNPCGWSRASSGPVTPPFASRAARRPVSEGSLAVSSFESGAMKPGTVGRGA